MSSLRQKSITSIKWSAVAKFSNYFLKFTLGVVLARLLSPAEFGLVAMVTVISELSNFFIDGGFSASLIQNKDFDKCDASTIFYVNVALGLFFAALLIVTAPLFAQFYDDIRLTSIARTISFVYVLSSMNVVQKAQLSRQLDYKKLSIIEVIQQLAGGILGITLALFGFSYWSIVYKRIFQELMRLGLYYKLTKWVPDWSFEKNILKKHWRFSSWALAAGITKQIADRFDYLIVGKVFTAANLGIFQRGKNIARMPIEFTASVFNNPLFAAFSRLQDNKEKFLENYIKIYRVITLIVMPIMVLSFVLADEIIFILLGEKWMESALFLKYFSVWGFIYIFSVNKFRLLSSLGFPKYGANYNLFDLVFRPVTILLFFFVFNIRSMEIIAIIYIVSFFLRFIYSSIKLKNHLNTNFITITFANFRELIIVISPALLSYILVNNIIVLVGLTPIYKLFLVLTLYLSIYISLAFFAIKPIIMEIHSMISTNK
jgi:O-antigen/teichoic acid export membrane protein